MLEGGKRFIARGLLNQIGQFVRLGYFSDVNVRIATWGNELKVLEWSLTDEVPAEILNRRIAWSAFSFQPREKCGN